MIDNFGKTEKYFFFTSSKKDIVHTRATEKEQILVLCTVAAP